MSDGLLPSFLYLPHPSELAAGDPSLPWNVDQDFAVGEMARSRGAPSGPRHTHRHRHAPITHTHPHFPDAHHQHRH